MDDDVVAEERFADEKISTPEGDKSVLLEVIKRERDQAKESILTALRFRGANDLCISYMRMRFDFYLNNFSYMRNFHRNFAASEITKTSLRFGENLARDLFGNYPLFDLNPNELFTIIVDATQVVNSACWGAFTNRTISDKQLIAETTEYRQYQDDPMSQKKSFWKSLFG